MSRAGPPDVLQLRDIDTPEPGAAQVRIAVRAAGVNRADVLQRRGLYPAPPGAPADIPGLEYAGVIDALGPGVTSWRVGDRVMGLVGGGACAEYVVVQEREPSPIPERLSFTEAAAVPEVFITAHDALFTLGRLAPGERVLIHAVGSGVGTAALQLVRAAGATAIGTSRSEWKLERALSLGLNHGIGGDGFVDSVRRLAPEGIDLVLDLVGGDYVARDLQVLRTRGRIVLVGLTAGRSAQLDLGVLLSRRITLVGTVLRSRPLDEKLAAVRAFEHSVLPLLESGIVHPVINDVLPLEQAAAAHRRLEANETFGKIVLEV